MPFAPFPSVTDGRTDGRRTDGPSRPRPRAGQLSARVGAATLRSNIHSLIVYLCGDINSIVIRFIVRLVKVSIVMRYKLVYSRI